MTTPLTTQRMGSRVCPGCERSLADGRAVIECDGWEPVRNRYGGFSDGRTRPVVRRWHADCLTDFEAANDRLREQVRADRIAALRSIGEAAGWSSVQIEEAVARYTT